MVTTKIFPAHALLDYLRLEYIDLNGSDVTKRFLRLKKVTDNSEPEKLNPHNTESKPLEIKLNELASYSARVF